MSHISGEMPTHAKIESTYRRLQRFFQHVVLGEDWSARLVIRMLGLSGNWHLCLDRTNWKIGRKEINLLVLAVATRRYRVPVIWMVLGKAGNSSTKERIALMKRYLDLFGAESIKYLLTDREFRAFTAHFGTPKDDAPLWLNFAAKRIKGKEVADCCQQSASPPCPDHLSLALGHRIHVR